jgi:hypothetical protein
MSCAPASQLNQIEDLFKFPFASSALEPGISYQNLNRVGDQGIEPCTSRTRIEHSTDELVPENTIIITGCFIYLQP